MKVLFCVVVVRSWCRDVGVGSLMLPRSVCLGCPTLYVVGGVVFVTVLVACTFHAVLGRGHGCAVLSG